MLREISCDKFKRNGIIRKPIVFNSGVNFIVGDNNSSNSIGKSTFLLIIDFCFGGVDFINKEKELHEEIGEHDIKFVFEFDKVKYHFIRNTSKDKYQYIIECDENYNEIRKLTLTDFNDFLLTKYKLAYTDNTFRHAISPFFRIYNRQTYNEYKPLNSSIRQSDSEGVNLLLQLFDKHSEINELNEILHKDEEERNAIKYLINKENIILPNSNEELNKNLQEMEKVNSDIEILYSTLRDNITNNNNAEMIDMLDIVNRAFLVEEKNKLYLRLSRITSKMNSIDINNKFNKDEFVHDFKKLQAFFPDANIEKIEQLEKFRKNIQKNLKKEINKQNAVYSAQKDMLLLEIKNIDTKLLDFQRTPDVSKKIIQYYSLLNTKIDKLKKANLKYQEMMKINKRYKQNEQKLKNLVEKYCSSITTIINDTIKKDFNTIKKDHKESPILMVNKLNSYFLYTPNDTGTGSRYTALFLLDVSILKNTKIPALIHDSIIFTNIEQDTASNMLSLFENIRDKQVFIALEEVPKYTKNYNTKLLIQNNTVLELSTDGDALYGYQFNKK